MDIFFIILGLPLGLLLFFISNKVENKKNKMDREEKEAVALQKIKDEKKRISDAPMKANECVCNWVNRSGENLIRSGYCHIHKTTWF